MGPVNTLNDKIGLQAGPSLHRVKRSLAAHQIAFLQTVGLVGNMQALRQNLKIFHTHDRPLFLIFVVIR